MTQPAVTTTPTPPSVPHRWARPATVMLELFLLLGALTAVLGLIPAQEAADELSPISPTIGEIVVGVTVPLLFAALLVAFIRLAPGWSRWQKGELAATPIVAVIVVVLLTRIGPGWVTAAVGMVALAALASVPMRLARLGAQPSSDTETGATR